MNMAGVGLGWGEALEVRAQQYCPYSFVQKNAAPVEIVHRNAESLLRSALLFAESSISRNIYPLE
jgi:hypothetical protein